MLQHVWKHFLEDTITKKGWKEKHYDACIYCDNFFHDFPLKCDVYRYVAYLWGTSRRHSALDCVNEHAEMQNTPLNKYGAKKLKTFTDD